MATQNSNKTELLNTAQELRSLSKWPRCEQDRSTYDDVRSMLTAVADKLESVATRVNNGESVGETQDSDDDVQPVNSNEVLKEFVKPQLQGTFTTYKSTEKLVETALLDQLKTQSHICDVTLAVRGQEVRAHWCILVACPYFEAMDHFQETCQTKTSRRFINMDYCTMDTLRLILYYLYTETIEINETNIYGIITTADFLQITTLIQHCVFFLKSRAIPYITPETSAMFYHLAIKYNLDNLADKCISSLSDLLPIDTLHKMISSCKHTMNELVEWIVKQCKIVDDSLVDKHIVGEEILRRLIKNGIDVIFAQDNPKVNEAVLRVYIDVYGKEICYRYCPIDDRWQLLKSKTRPEIDAYCKSKATLYAMEHVFTKLVPRKDAESLLKDSSLNELVFQLSAQLCNSKKANCVKMDRLAEQIFGQTVLLGIWNKPVVAVDVFVMPAKINGMETMAVFIPNESRWARVEKLDLLKYSRLQFLFSNTAHDKLFYCSRERLLRFNIRNNETTTLTNRVCEYGETVVGMWSAYEKIYVVSVQKRTSDLNDYMVRLCVRQIGSESSDASLKTLHQTAEYECVWYRFQQQNFFAFNRYIVLFCYYATDHHHNMAVAKSVFVWDCLTDEGYSADNYAPEMFTQDSLRKLLMFECDKKLCVWLSGSHSEYRLSFVDKTWQRIDPTVKQCKFLSEYNRFRSVMYNDCWYLFGYKPKAPIAVAVTRPSSPSWCVYDINEMSVALTGYSYNSPIMIKIPMTDICHI